jgi:hypothetical protein
VDDESRLLRTMKLYLLSLLALVACATHDAAPSEPSGAPIKNAPPPAVANAAPGASRANSANPPAAATAPAHSAKASQSLKARALANGACYGGATYGIQNSGLTAAELVALDDELSMEPGTGEMAGGYGYAAPKAAVVFPLCKPKTK